MIKKVNSFEEYSRIGYVKKAPKEDITMGMDTHERAGRVFEKSFWDGERYIINSRTYFVKVYRPSDSNDCPGLVDVIDDVTDFGRMMMIIVKYLDDKNMITYVNKHTKKGMAASRELLYEMTGLSESRARKFVKKMSDLGVIKEWKCGNVSRFYVNPIYTMRQAGIPLDLYKLFRESLVPYLTQKAIDDLDTLVYYEQCPEELVAMQKEEERKKEEEVDKLTEQLFGADKLPPMPYIKPGTSAIDLLLAGHEWEDVMRWFEIEAEEEKEATTAPASVVIAQN